MKYTISDLLDLYEENDVNIKDKNIASSKKIKELTMEKIESRKKKARPITRILIIAAIVAAISGAALANSLGAGSYFRNIFYNELTEEQVQVLDEVGTTSMESVTDHGTTITPVAALADENLCYIVLEIEGPEGTQFRKLTENEGYYQLGLDFESLEALGGFSMGTYWYPDENQVSNRITAVITIEGTTEKLNDGGEKWIRFDNIYIQSPEKEYTLFLEGTWAFEYGRNLTSQSVEVPVDGMIVSRVNEDFDDAWQLTLTDMKISSLGIRVCYSYSANTKMVTPVPGPIKVVMKDGSEIGVTISTQVLFEEPFDEEFLAQAEEAYARSIEEQRAAYESSKTAEYSTYYEEWSLYFISPVNLDEVAYIQLGHDELQIPLNNN